MVQETPDVLAVASFTNVTEKLLHHTSPITSFYVLKIIGYTNGFFLTIVVGVLGIITNSANTSVYLTMGLSETTNISVYLTMGLSETTNISVYLTMGLSETTNISVYLTMGLSETTNISVYLTMGLSETANISVYLTMGLSETTNISFFSLSISDLLVSLSAVLVQLTYNPPVSMMKLPSGTPVS
ncbi:hypothetical protein RRG08_046387 [Elysia crispata]|uniref:Uncharacterized protein n=1 Tax=Elysia crispata TaxID=231223 RepID=A0AAE1A8B2_9GAST|nr:hypothetical protein RRG08_046387 [Elysia crispata]